MKRPDIAKAVARERAKLVADLRSIGPEAWDTQSLCDEWKVRDVAAHLVRIGDFYRRLPIAVGDLARHGFRLNRALSEVAKRIAKDRSPAELLEMLGGARYEDTLVFRVHPQPRFALSEWIVHGQDIRRPLGISATYEPDHLMAIAETATKWYAWDHEEHTPKMRLEATDADWSIGEGPVYRGPLEAIVMVVLGRKAAMKDLTPQT